MAKARSVEAWASFLSTLSQSAREALAGSPAGAAPVREEGAVEYHTWRSTLSSAAQQAVDNLVRSAEAAPAPSRFDPRAVRYCAVEVPNGGDWPALRLFGDLDGLVQRVRQLEGEDVSLYIFCGIPLAYTRGPTRYLRLQDQVMAAKVPHAADEDLVIVPFSSLDYAEIQEDNFLGCKELSETDAGPSHPANQRALAAPAQLDDDDDGAGAGAHLD